MPRSSVKSYIRAYGGDYLLCVLSSCGLAVNAFAGFYLEDTPAAHLWITAAVIAVFMALLFCAGYNKRAMGIGIAAGVLALAAAVAILARNGAWHAETTTMEADALFWILVLTVPLAVYLAARSRAGLIALFLFGTIMTAAFSFLQYPISLTAYLLFVPAVCILFFYRVYCISLLKADTGRTAFFPYLVQSLLTATASLAIAALVFFTLIAPLDPPTDELKLTTRLMSMEILEKVGVSSKLTITADDQFSSRLDDTIKTSDNPEEQTPEPEPEENPAWQTGDNTFVIDSMDKMAQAISYIQRSYLLYYAAAALLVLLAVPPAIKRLLRKRWYAQTLAQPREDGVLRFYLFFTKLLRWAGFCKPPDLTWSEYTAAARDRLARFTSGAADFSLLTEIYVKVLYGCQPVSEEEYALFKQFYLGFYPCLRKELGLFKYCFAYLRL